MFGRQKIVEKRTVLFVDDDETILRSLKRGLLDESYNKLFVKSSTEALEILKRKKVHVKQCKIMNNKKSPCGAEGEGKARKPAGA